MADTGFVVEGLTDLIRDLRAVDRTIPAAVYKGFKAEMTSRLLPTARAAAGNQPVPKSSGMITVYATQREAGLRLRYSQFPWAAGAEFGSRKYRQFRPWVGNQWTGSGQFPGYMIGPAFRRHLGDLDGSIVDAVRHVLIERGLGRFLN